MIGILGGLGPQAAGDFYSRLVDGFSKKGISPNPHIVLNTIPDPGIDCLQKNLNLKPHVEGILFLVQNHAKIIVMACNTIHIHLNFLRQATQFQNILSIREAVKQILKPYLISGKKICFLSTSVTSQQKLYYFKD